MFGRSTERSVGERGVARRAGRRRAVVIGGGMGGLSAAVDLARAGLAVTLVERAATPGGKLREVEVGGARIDAGPTVLTMASVFESLFTDAGAELSQRVSLKPARILARHAWSEGQRLDLYADAQRSADAIGEFAGASEADGFRRFAADAARVYRALDERYIRAPKPRNAIALAGRFGPSHAAELLSISPFSTLWDTLGKYFRDPRLRQLFGRYATYCGSSPFLAPATLMLVAHVEQTGVWLVEGGMHQLAVALAELATALGANLRYGCEAEEIVTDSRGRACGVRLRDGERLDADAVVVNADPIALASGRFGRSVAGAVGTIDRRARSLSAVTWCLHVRARGFPLVRHNVFFSADYAEEFRDLTERFRVPSDPTVYVCAQDRDAADSAAPTGDERLFCLVNAPADGDSAGTERFDLAEVRARAFAVLERCGLSVEERPDRTVATTPAEFERLFPATGGALYGRASHGWRASFVRPEARTRVPGVYLAGGATHPGPGVPLSALSGRQAAAALLADLRT